LESIPGLPERLKNGLCSSASILTQLSQRVFQAGTRQTFGLENRKAAKLSTKAFAYFSTCYLHNLYDEVSNDNWVLRERSLEAAIIILIIVRNAVQKLKVCTVSICN
jgi:hypothetical protein